LIQDAIPANELNREGEAALYESLRTMWHPVAASADLAESPLRVLLLDEPLVVVRLNGQICAFPDLCLHRGTALSLGWVEDGQLRCPYHGWTYGSDGMCTGIPAHHGTKIPKRACLRALRVTEALGLIWVCLDDQPLFDVPSYPEFHDPNFHVLRMPVYDWNCSAARRVENFVDLAHIPWVHDGIIGRRDEPEVPEHEVWREGAELRMAAAVKEPASVKTGASFTASVTWRLIMPFTVVWNQELPDQRHFGGFIAASPLGRKLTRTFTLRHLNYEVEETKLLELEQVIAEADRVIAESQRPEELPVDLTAELHIRGADRISIEYRKWLIEIYKKYGGLAIAR